MKKKIIETPLTELTQNIEILLRLINQEVTNRPESELAENEADLIQMKDTLKNLYWKLRDRILSDL